ncbi:MAG: glycosyltransferase family 2 protein [Alphaproteobacteria bacterium]|nr:glycosyltransferase family 2 protein [Alphaproteobacteria bacterium]
MTDNPLVSVVIPIYKVEQYLQRCVDSVINQTYKKLEIILVDDGSPDNCPQICDEYALQDSRIKVIHKENGGLSDARNAGTKVSSGEYLYYLDSDDEITPDCIMLMVDAVKQYPNVEMVQGGMKSIPYSSYYDRPWMQNITHINDNKWIRQHFYCVDEQLPVNAVNKLFKKSFIVDNALYFKKGLIHEDELWMYFTVKKVNYIVIVHQNTYIRYYNPNSIMTTNTQKRSATHWAVILNEILNTLDNPCYEKQLLKYCLFAIGYYGVLEDYKGILKNYSTRLRKNGCGFISFLIFCFRISYPIVKGRLIRRVLVHFIRERLKK